MRSLFGGWSAGAVFGLSTILLTASGCVGDAGDAGASYNFV